MLSVVDQHRKGVDPVRDHSRALLVLIAATAIVAGACQQAATPSGSPSPSSAGTGGTAAAPTPAPTPPMPVAAGPVHPVPAAGQAGSAAGAVRPPGRASGWAVPDELRTRWKLYLGDARELLPAVLGALEQVDVFLHDSDHSYDHMTFELEQALPRLAHGGLLLSDDPVAVCNFNDRRKLLSLAPQLNFDPAADLAP